MHSLCMMTPGSGKALHSLKESCSISERAALKVILDEVVQKGVNGLEGLSIKTAVKENDPPIKEIRKGRIRIFYITVKCSLVILDAWYKQNRRITDFERQSLKKVAKSAKDNYYQLDYLC